MKKWPFFTISVSGSNSNSHKDLVNMLMPWRHFGFNVFCGPRIQPEDEEAIENLARYIIRASLFQERITYVSEEAKVVHKSKDRKNA